MERVSHIKLGDTSDWETSMGPLISATQLARVMGYIEKGLAEGATLACGGGRPAGIEKGFFVEPTIFVDVDNNATIAREEIFGPVLAVIKYKTLDDAIRMANDSIYGLGGAVFSRDIPKAIGIAKRIRAGTVWINDYHLINGLAPFGGYKQSGVGRVAASGGEARGGAVAYKAEDLSFLFYTPTRSGHAGHAGRAGGPGRGRRGGPARRRARAPLYSERRRGPRRRLGGVRAGGPLRRRHHLQRQAGLRPR